MPTKTNQPIHDHDCTCCEFLYGFLTRVHLDQTPVFKVTDVYLCNGEASSEGGTLILRTGAEGDYAARPIRLLLDAKWFMDPEWQEALNAVKARQGALDAIAKDKRIAEVLEVLKRSGRLHQ